MILASLRGEAREYDDIRRPANPQRNATRVNASVKRPRPSWRLLGWVGMVAIAVAVALAFDRHASSAYTPQAPPQASSPGGASFDPAVVARGAWLAAIGNCGSCHTAAGGATFAGGRPLSTPFGTIYATNITPDPETGIGRWSASDFLRAMHEGLGKDGRELYPAFPYDHFTHVTGDDVNAIYAFLMTRDPARVETPANRILVPRAAVAVWKALYFKPGPLVADPVHDARWNRGRYLVDGLGHCGGCHTPRNAFGAEKPDEDLAGNNIEGWRAPALNASAPAPAPWTVEQATTYLHTGFDATHGTAAGSMASVAHNLAGVPAAEVDAIAAYIVARMEGGVAKSGTDNARPTPGGATAERSARSEDAGIDPRQGNDGGAIYRSTCAGCHEDSRRGIALDRSTSTTDVSPANLIRITLDGIHPREGEKGGIMPAFHGALDDTQLSALVTFVRATLGRAPPWPDVPGEIAKAKRASEDVHKGGES
jgi:mono/diheme cytochrome c family protein